MLWYSKIREMSPIHPNQYASPIKLEIKLVINRSEGESQFILLDPNHVSVLECVLRMPINLCCLA